MATVLLKTGCEHASILAVYGYLNAFTPLVCHKGPNLYRI